MQAQFIHDGKAVDFTPTVDVAVGSIVVQGELVGITKRDIKAGSLGSIAVEGVFDIPKDPALAVSLDAGTKVYVDEDGAVVADDLGTTYLGKVVADAAATDSFVRIRLSQ
jgi:predicted RecA/RadA family phage recombinase